VKLSITEDCFAATKTSNLTLTDENAAFIRASWQTNIRS